MPKHQTSITAEIHAEDHYHLSFNENSLCFWFKCPGKEIPKKHCNNKAFRSFYNRHIKDIKEALKEGIFEVRYKEGVVFGVYTLSDLSPPQKRTRRQ
eukprot:5501277-Ditylum_brightwellii.AAC.1